MQSKYVHNSYMLQLIHGDKLLIYFERNLINKVLQNKRQERIYMPKLLFYNDSVVRYSLARKILPPFCY